MDIRRLQEDMKKLFGEEDQKSGPHFLMGVLAEETGELAAAIRGKGDIAEETADVIFMALSIANLYDIDVSDAIQKKYIDRSKEEICSSWNDTPWKNG